MSWVLAIVRCFCLNNHYMCNFSKDRLELQVEVNVVEGMDMCTKEKQLGVNMQQQVIIVLMPFFDFMDSLKILKAICSHV